MEFTYEMLERGWRNTVTINSTEPNRVRYRYFLEDNLYALLAALQDGSFQPSPMRLKQIYYPKPRIAQVPSLNDKIVQHVICDNYATEALQKSLIKETSACIKGRGDGHASQILIDQLHNYYQKYGSSFYCLKCDIHGYFASIEHSRVESLIDRYVFDPDVILILKKFVRSSDRGLPLGLQQSQILANLYLSELDHRMKETLRSRYYGRYMDDFRIISDNLDYLQYCWHDIEDYVSTIGLELNPKTTIVRNSVSFLGFQYHLTDTGKVIKALDKSKKNSKRRQLNLMLDQLQYGDLSAKKFADSYGGYRSHVLRGNCNALIHNWDSWVRERLRELGYGLYIKDKSVSIYNLK